MEPTQENLMENGRIKKDVDLFPYLSMRLHTIAQYFFEALSEEDLINAFATAKK
jgi:hypothetical protein